MKNSKLIWTICRTLTFLVVGLFNTVLIRPEDVGSWKNYLGYFLLALALYDIIALLVKIRRTNKIAKDQRKV